MAASSRTNLVSMLDPQAQMSINKTNTGTASYVKRQASGATTTAKPTYVQGSLTEDVNAVTLGQGISPETLRATQILSQREQNLRDFQAGVQSGDPQYRSGGGALSGGGGGGGGAPTPGTPVTPGTPPPPQGPAAPAAPNAGATALQGYTEDEITAALAGLEAQFGMTRAQLLADQTQAGAQYRLLLAQLERGRVQGIETATNDAVRRGIYRSGILGENIADVESATLEGRGVAEAQLQGRQQATEAQLRNLDAMEAAQGAQIEAQLRRQYAQTMLEAGMNPGEGMRSAGMPMPAPTPPVAPTAAAPVVNTQGVVGTGGPSANTLATPVATQQSQSEEELYRQRLAEIYAQQQAYPYRPPVDYSQWQMPGAYNPMVSPGQISIGGGLRVL